jgi:hypothetical protein
MSEPTITIKAQVEMLDDEPTGAPCPMCDDAVYFNAKRPSLPLLVLFEDGNGLHRHTIKDGLCASCADVLKDLIK